MICDVISVYDRNVALNVSSAVQHEYEVETVVRQDGEVYVVRFRALKPSHHVAHIIAYARGVVDGFMIPRGDGG